MTVISLWKALDRAGCGRAIGADDLVDHHGGRKTSVNPWTVNQRPKVQAPTLAVDLSIWICESLSSSVIAENHADPTLHLVFTRTVKLLNLGVKVVGVLDGKRRIRKDGEKDELEQRRSGTPFWRASMRCKELFDLLGVPIVRATAEAEALCAFLNLKGVVDGVISNDGDCFLFGARTLYTKFSIENLRERRVMRYDAEKLVACLDDDDSDAIHTLLDRDEKNNAPTDVVNLTQNDLIAFAILTGSDVAGAGFPKVGSRKALRFVRRCQIANPLRPDTATVDEMMSWAKSCLVSGLEATDTNDCKKCSVCFHFGTKSSHMKYGCIQCGTKAGEGCFHVSPGEKFRKSLRAKALALVPAFDPKSVYDIYLSPNDNQMPQPFVGLTSRDVTMKPPDLENLLCTAFIVRGRTYAESRKYVLESISRLLANVEIARQQASVGAHQPGDEWTKLPNKNRPVPVKILKSTARSSSACYEVLWNIHASTTDSDGNPINEYEFITTETQATVQRMYPDLVSTFLSAENERVKQGPAQQEKRRVFLDEITKHCVAYPNEDTMRLNLGNKRDYGRKQYFAKRHSICADEVGKSVNFANTSSTALHRSQIFKGMGDDVAQLLKISAGIAPALLHVNDNDSVQTTPSSLSGESLELTSTVKIVNVSNQGSPYKFPLTPSHIHFLKQREDATENIEKSMAYLHSHVFGLPNRLSRIQAEEKDPTTFGAPPDARDSRCPPSESLRGLQGCPKEQTFTTCEVPFMPRSVLHRASMGWQVKDSPYLKRTRKSIGSRGTPSLSRNRSLLNAGCSSDLPETSLPSQHLDSVISKWTMGHQMHRPWECRLLHDDSLGEYDDQENTFATTRAATSGQSWYLPDSSGPRNGCIGSTQLQCPAEALVGSFADVSMHKIRSIRTIPSISAPQDGTYSRRDSCRESIGVGSFNVNDVDTCLGSFGNISIHTIPSIQVARPTSKQQSNHRQSCITKCPWNEVNLAPVALRDDDDESLHPTYLFSDGLPAANVERSTFLTARNKEMTDRDGLVKVALANLETKTKAAERHERDESLLRVAQWQHEHGL